MSCELCQRDIELTRHHLIPVSTHKKYRKKRTREELSQLVMICRECHNQIHVLISEKEMAAYYNTLESLLAHPGVARFVEWLRKRQPSSHIKVRSTRR